MKLSFIIPAYNEEKYISSCIQSIHDSMKYFMESKPENYEVIVANNNSTDRTVTFQSWCRSCFTDAKNIAGVRNAGAKLATGDYLIFIDADTQINKLLLQEVFFAVANFKLFGGALLTLDKPSLFGNIATSIWNAICIHKKWYTGCFIFVERNLFNSIGGFNENLFLLEDIDLSNRLNKTSSKYGKLIEESHIVTSARKLTLYKWHEHLRFWFTLLFRFKQTLTTRKLCFMWYDGRR